MKRFLLASAVLLAAGSAQAAVTISTFPTAGTTGGFSFLKSFGSVFTTPTGHTVMNDFTLHMIGFGVVVDFTAHVAEWNGPTTFATGHGTPKAPLWSSGVQTFTADQNGTRLDITVNTGALQLKAATPYVAFFTIAGQTRTGSTAFGTNSFGGSSAARVNIHYLVNDSSASPFSNPAWNYDDSRRGEPAAFAATFSAPAVIPEPSTWMMMILGFGLVAQALRRRHRATAAA